MSAQIVGERVRIRRLPGMVAAAMLACYVSSAGAQATSRPCKLEAGSGESAGPACLLAHQSLGALDGEAVYWSLYIYPDLAAAQNDKAVGGVVVQAFNKIWVFSIGSSAAKSTVGEHIADVGPIPVEKSVLYDAEFLKSTFSPGMVAPVHVHSGPEAFYAISGATCLETPQGVQVAKGAGNRLVVPGGAPMLLMAVGPEPRQGFALILHNREHAPTTLVNDWTPKNLCRAALP